MRPAGPSLVAAPAGGPAAAAAAPRTLLPSAAHSPWAAGAAPLRPKAAVAAASLRHRPARRGRRGCSAVTEAMLGALPPPKQVTGAMGSVDRDADPWSLEDAAHLFRRDQGKEAGRRHMRTLSTFTFERWAFHRSTSRYLRHMLGIFQSGIVRGLAEPLLSAGATATLVCIYEELLHNGVLPEALPSLLMPTVPFDVTSFALSLLLVFRTNTSYDRWLQAVTVWGGISNRSRDSLRQVLAYSGAGAGSSGSGALTSIITGAKMGGGSGGRDAQLSAAAMCRWLVAFSRSLKEHLTEDSNLQAELQGVLTEQEMALLLAAPHRPSFALAVLSELAAAAQLRDSQRIRLDENLTFFQDAVGTCERILRTPIPLSYTRHTSRFMVIWLSALPLGLWPTCSWGTIPLTVVISFLLLGIEEIGVAIEEPFSILPLEDFCLQLEVDVNSIVQQAPSSKQAAQEAAAAATAAVAAAPSGGSGGSAAAAASAAAATSGLMASNAVAPFLPLAGAGVAVRSAGGGGGGAREAVVAAGTLAPEAIFSSMDDELEA